MLAELVVRLQQDGPSRAVHREVDRCTPACGGVIEPVVGVKERRCDAVVDLACDWALVRRKDMCVGETRDQSRSRRISRRSTTLFEPRLSAPPLLKNLGKSSSELPNCCVADGFPSHHSPSFWGTLKAQTNRLSHPSIDRALQSIDRSIWPPFRPPSVGGPPSPNRLRRQIESRPLAIDRLMKMMQKRRTHASQSISDCPAHRIWLLHVSPPPLQSIHIHRHRRHRRCRRAQQRDEGKMMQAPIMVLSKCPPSFHLCSLPFLTQHNPI